MTTAFFSSPFFIAFVCDVGLGKDGRAKLSYQSAMATLSLQTLRGPRSAVASPYGTCDEALLSNEIGNSYAGVRGLYD